MAGGAVGSGKDIAAQVVGVGPGLAAARSGKQLVQVVIGVAVAGSICKAGARQRTVPCLVCRPLSCFG